MKSLILTATGGLLFVFLAACQVETIRRSSVESRAENQSLVDPKYSLSKDRSEFEKLRKSIPENVRQSNDEKALMAEWFADVKLAPEKIRDQFDSLGRKKRDLFNKDLTKQREAFNKDERKKREDFLKDLEDERKNFLSRKVSKEQRAEFFNDQDEKRKTFFSEQKEKRDAFESDVREKRKDFEDYMKEKSNDFTAELKTYRVKWTEKEKAKHQN